jgi:hypothetical protein
LKKVNLTFRKVKDNFPSGLQITEEKKRPKKSGQKPILWLVGAINKMQVRVGTTWKRCI